MKTIEEYKSVDSNRIAQALVGRYAREIEALKTKSRLEARDLARLRELRQAAQAHARLIKR